MNINDITAGQKKINVTGAIIGKSEPRDVNLKSGGTNQTCDVELSDHTGKIKLVLWGAEVPKVNVGDSVTIENGYTTAYKGVTQLSIGQFGKLSVVAAVVPKPAEQSGYTLVQARGDILKLNERLSRLEATIEAR